MINKKVDLWSLLGVEGGGCERTRRTTPPPP